MRKEFSFRASPQINLNTDLNPSVMLFLECETDAVQKRITYDNMLNVESLRHDLSDRGWTLTVAAQSQNDPSRSFFEATEPDGDLHETIESIIEAWAYVIAIQVHYVSTQFGGTIAITTTMSLTGHETEVEMLDDSQIPDVVQNQLLERGFISQANNHLTMQGADAHAIAVNALPNGATATRKLTCYFKEQRR